MTTACAPDAKALPRLHDTQDLCENSFAHVFWMMSL